MTGSNGSNGDPSKDADLTTDERLIVLQSEIKRLKSNEACRKSRQNKKVKEAEGVSKIFQLEQANMDLNRKLLICETEKTLCIKEIKKLEQDMSRIQAYKGIVDYFQQYLVANGHNDLALKLLERVTYIINAPVTEASTSTSTLESIRKPSGPQ